MTIIIGGGPIGLACGIELKKKNIPFLIIEKGSIVDSIYHYPVNMTFFSTSDRLELSDVPFISHNAKPTRREALEYYRRVASSFDLPIHLYEEVLEVNGSNENFIVKTNKNVYNAAKIVVATGFYGLPNLLGVEGEHLQKVKHYYDEPHPYAKQKIAVIGAGNSAVDVALETYRSGADVTMVVRDAGIKESVKYWVKPDIENRIKSGEIKAFFNSEVLEISNFEIKIKTPELTLTIENDFVLAMTGYTPNYNLLHKMGIPYGDDEFQTPMYNPLTHESEKQGMYLAGVVCGGLQTNKWFIENAREHAVLIANHIANT
ncbi:YpdA family putative bacillithiol disulfide reductase [bacterium]|nr:MAG: YpdA family putative bacillithiol disulfide reductase [bacterium]